MPFALKIADHLELALRRRFRQKIVHACLCGDGCCRNRIVACNHNRFDSHFSQIGKLLLHSLFDDILQIDNTQNFMVFSYNQRSSAF